MKLRKTFKYKLYRTKRQKYLNEQVNIACAIYNHCIALHKRYYRLFKKSINCYKLQHHLTKVKRRRIWWTKVGSQAIQDITDRIDKAYALFFRNIKAGIKTAPPGFKKRLRYKSFTLKQNGWKVTDNVLRVGKRTFKFSKSRELNGTVKTVTLKRNSLGEFFVLFSVELEENNPIRITSGNSVGFDFGLRHFLTDETGAITEAPEFLKESMKDLRKASKSLSSKKKGSNNRHKARIKLARLHEGIQNKRLDFQHKLARKFSLLCDNIFVESLDMQAMSKRWGRKISDLGFYSFLQLLEYHCAKNGSNLVKVPKYFPSSKTCSSCNEINDNLTLKDTSWVCSCGAKHNRDINAAKNIFRVGSEMLLSKIVGASTIRVENVSEAQASSFC